MGGFAWFPWKAPSKQGTIKNKHTNKPLFSLFEQNLLGPLGGEVYRGESKEHSLALRPTDIVRKVPTAFSNGNPSAEVFTYRYFINNWPDLCYLAMQGTRKKHRCRGYMATGKWALARLVALCIVFAYVCVYVKNKTHSRRKQT